VNICVHFPSEALNYCAFFSVGPVVNGTFTWTSITSPQPMCRELTRQVGQSWPIWVDIQVAGASFTLKWTEEPEDFLGGNPLVFAGTISGNTVTASTSGGGGFSCPEPGPVGSLISRTMQATLTSNGIEGDVTEVYMSGGDEVVFLYHFQAKL
jgi:hypothetical protein